jgi:nucleoid DNA-binding protein
MTKTEMTAAIAADTGFTKTAVFAALSAMEQQLRVEGMARRAVELTDFGTFWPRQKRGKRTGRSLSGGQVTYDNWCLVDNPELVEEAEFYASAAALAEMKLTQFELIMQNYKDKVVQTLRAGGSVSSNGEGSFKVEKRKPRVFRRDDGTVSSKAPARRAVVYKSSKLGVHQKFVAVPDLV